MDPPERAAPGKGRCPECGYLDPGEGPPPAAGRRRARITRVIAGLLLLVVALLLYACSTTSAMTSGGALAMLVEPAYTLEDLRAIKADGTDGTHAPGQLIRSVLAAPSFTDWTPGDAALEFQFDSPSGARTELVTRGWPTPLVLRTRRISYEDAARRIGFLAAATDPSITLLGPYAGPSDPRRVPPRPRWAWHADELRFQPPPEETGGVDVITSFRPGALAAPAAMLLLIWLFTGAAAWALRRTTRREILGVRKRWAILAVAFCALLAAGFLSRREAISPPLSSMYTRRQFGPPGSGYHAHLQWVEAPRYRVEPRRSDLLAWPATAESDRRLAAEILRTVPHADVPAMSCLFVAVELEAHMARSTAGSMVRSFPVVSHTRTVWGRRPDFGPLEEIVPARRFEATFNGGRWRFTLNTAAPGTPNHTLSIHAENAAMVLLGPWGVGLAAAAAARPLQVLTTRRRRARGQCVECGYQISEE